MNVYQLLAHHPSGPPIHPQTLSGVTQTTTRTLSDTLQTPSNLALGEMLKECLHCSLLMKTLHDIITPPPPPPDSIQNHRENPHIPPSWEVFGGCLSRHLPDTLQTPHRHPILLIVLGHFLAIPRPLGEKESADEN